MAGKKQTPSKARIGPRRPKKIYLAEWREKRGLTQKQLGERLDPIVTDMTVSRWEKAARGDRGPNTAQMNDDVKAAVAEALDLEPEDLYRHPDTPSADELLRNAPQSIKEQAFKVIEALIGRRAG
jgi:transcriptional regulator with XRE-family HTH domain